MLLFRKKLLLVFVICPLLSIASNLQLSEPLLYNDAENPYFIVNVKWNNSWNNSKNHDAAWLFSKFLRGNGYIHAKVNGSGHEVINVKEGPESAIKFEVAPDSVGLYLYSEKSYRGNIDITVKIIINRNSIKNVRIRSFPLKVYGIEMVYIPKGGFYVGDPDTTSLKYSSLYKSDKNGAYKSVYEIKKENQVIKIEGTDNNLYYRAPDSYRGDQKGELSEDFPKGVNPFYIMKYEPTQGQYAQFLNTLSNYQSQSRANFGGKGYYEQRGTINIKDGKYYAGNPSATCNYMSWDDAMAYADWAGLRPMTELEFTKACRGPVKPQQKDYPWGTEAKEKVMRIIATNGNYEMINDWSESKLSDDNRVSFGASYYWVMDLAGSLWERVITIGDEKGRGFKGTHGDGRLTNYGFATNKDWPLGITETGGYGFRGGGFYGYGREYTAYNPYSPVAYRPYGGWSGGNRTNSYGARFVKTAE